MDCGEGKKVGSHETKVAQVISTSRNNLEVLLNVKKQYYKTVLKS